MQGDLGRNGMGRKAHGGRRLGESVIAGPRLRDACCCHYLEAGAVVASASKEVAQQVEPEQDRRGQAQACMKENQKLKERLKEAEAKKKKNEQCSTMKKTRGAAPKKMPIKMPKGDVGLDSYEAGRDASAMATTWPRARPKDGKCTKGLHICVKLLEAVGTPRSIAQANAVSPWSR